MAPLTGSTWWCELCQVTVWVRYVPKRRRCQLCRKWMTRVWRSEQR